MTTADDNAEILGAIAADLELRVTAHRVISDSVSGDGYVSGHELELDTVDGDRQTQLIYLETRPSQEPRDGVLAFRNEETGDEVAAWLYPRDPALPALSTAVFPDAAAVVLRKLGIAADSLTIILVAYRPGKRAVVRMDTAAATVFVKILNPGLVAELHARYACWSDAGLPVPTTLGWTDDGLVAFAALGGVPASAAIADLGDSFLDSLEDIIRRYAAVPSATLARASLATRLSWYERRLAEHAPELADQVHPVCRRIESLLVAGGTPALVTVHNDLHLGQLFVDPEHPETITGILDIDTAGVGDPADDAGAFYAHLVVTAVFHHEHGDDETAEHFEQLAERWRRRWARHPDAGLVSRAHAIAATHLLAHALGSFVPPAALVSRAAALI